MRIVFCGTPLFAVPTLKYLLVKIDFEVVGVITQPDRRGGRGLEIMFSPTKETALAARIPVHQPEKIRDPETETLLRDLAPDAVVIIAYGQIVPARLLGIPRLGWINLHASLLPKYRGAAPINWAIVNGETRTGVTTMRIDAGMDTGEMLLQQEIEIRPGETAEQVRFRLSEFGGRLMADTLNGLDVGAITPAAQNHAEASYAPMLKKKDGRIDWERPAIEIYNRMRGFAPWPGAHTTFRGKRCQVWGEPAANEESVEVARGTVGAAPGTLWARQNELFVVCGGATVLRVQLVKVEGGRTLKAAEFANGARLKSGEQFGDEWFA